MSDPIDASGIEYLRKILHEKLPENPDDGATDVHGDIDEVLDLASRALLFPPSEPTEFMIHAYRLALRQLISSTPPAKRRWVKDARGYRIPEREKATARWKAMLEAARRELT